jgi:zinc and cadmium transporter
MIAPFRIPKRIGAAMDSLIFWIIGFTAIGGVLSVAVAASVLLLPAAVRLRMVAPLVSFAIGTLLGAAFLGLLPHALEAPGVQPHHITLAVLLGVLAFFVLEKLVIWHHCHTDDCEMHGHDHSVGAARHIEEMLRVAAGKLILVGHGIHSLVDGVLIAAAFLTDIRLGIVTSIAVAAHEVPQQVGDFAVLLQSGYRRGRALMLNVCWSLTTIAGGVAAYFSLSLAAAAVPYVVAVAAASFIYIAVADLIPGLHRRPAGSATVQQVALIGAGVAVIYLVQSALHCH